ncbi:MAG: helix-turn-helix domain-containing protein [Sulfurospirillaceae bacterium]|jgi:transcriptional regulator with XRE-family HTH domain|nr:helix-turn-helix domain-containing protein [Sulfurospirillaceae bacterium]MCK9545797.1 helix-turn-helix domain-containing protein [Sulfurospirillaceae bacterium]MDY0237623.1 helix-turn-helix transcriptional regulator [Campylobacterales bacterium]NLM98956.1 helix-turn-helix transcriptional regulator [Campylobacteraceae bacterium]
MKLLDLGKTIKELRKQRGLSQENLAKQSGISRATLSKLENGYIANISIVTVNQILSLLGYEIDIKPANPFMRE